MNHSLREPISLYKVTSVSSMLRPMEFPILVQSTFYLNEMYFLNYSSFLQEPWLCPHTSHLCCCPTGSLSQPCDSRAQELESGAASSWPSGPPWRCPPVSPFSFTNWCLPGFFPSYPPAPYPPPSTPRTFMLTPMTLHTPPFKSFQPLQLWLFCINYNLAKLCLNLQCLFKFRSQPMNRSWTLLYGYDQHISEETEWNRKEQKTLDTVKASTDTHRHGSWPLCKIYFFLWDMFKIIKSQFLTYYHIFRVSWYFFLISTSSCSKSSKPRTPTILSFPVDPCPTCTRILLQSGL